MEILTKTKYEVNNKEFNSLDEAEEYGNKLKIVNELKNISKSYMKETYMSLDDALEDAFIALVDNNPKAIKLLNQSTEIVEPF